jgi:hypothetical protein
MQTASAVNTGSIRLSISIFPFKVRTTYYPLFKDTAAPGSNRKNRQNPLKISIGQQDTLLTQVSLQGLPR